MSMRFNGIDPDDDGDGDDYVVNLTILLTNDPRLFPDLEGFLGLSPCHQSLNAYSFYH